MFNLRIFCFAICYFFIQVTFSQNNKLIISDSIVSVNTFDFDPKAPAKAAFYSAIVPGLGQAYNKKYWKIPLVYAALGTATYAYVYNNDLYTTYRDAYKLSVNGKPHDYDENSGQFLSDESLKRAQTVYKENRDLSLLIAIGLYALQIVEASVNAHLMQMDQRNNLSFNPNITIDPHTNKVVSGISISFAY